MTILRSTVLPYEIRPWISLYLVIYVAACSVSTIPAANAPPLERDDYLVWSSSCQIPNVDAFHESILPFLKPAEPIVCSRDPPLTSVAALGAMGRGKGHVLRVNKALRRYYAPRPRRLACCYSNVTRVTTPPGRSYTDQADNYYNISSCSVFETEVKLQPQEEFILVRCNSYKNGPRNQTKQVYAHMHSIIPIKPRVAEKRKESGNDGWLNVLIVGYDSISRLNLLRSMPRTVAYLKNVGYVDLLGYNKIGDNTFPNIIGMLTGMNVQQLSESCWPSSKSKLDDCPFIWKEFHAHNYVSAYGTDEATISAFNFKKTGFLKEPTDYYLRPFMLTASKKLKIRRRHNLEVCLGAISTTDHVLRYALDFVTTFKNARYFALFWLDNFSHNDVNIPRGIGRKTLRFFKELGAIGAYKNSMVIFLSDHGARFGNIRRTYVGWLEDKLPFIYILLPDWFKNKYPEAYKNLQTNRKRITSPYDLYATLKDVLQRGVNSTAAFGNVSLACPTCKSLFSEDFANRSCDDAGINRHWCACTKYVEVSVNDDIVQNVANYALSEIRKKVESSLYADRCVELIVHQVIIAKKEERVEKSGTVNDVYLVIFETSPGAGLFEATVRHSSDSYFSILGTISRINTYHEDSFCVEDAELKKYCFCRRL